MESMKLSTGKAGEIVPTRNLVRSGLYPEVLRFKLDDVCDDPVFGSAKHLEGEIPLLNASLAMQNQYSDLVTNPEKVERISRQIVAKYRDMWPDKDDEEILRTVRDQVLVIILEFGPNPNMESSVLETLAPYMAIAVYYDDVFDGNSGMAFPGPDQYDYGQVMATLRTNTGFCLADFPSGMAEWKVFGRIFQEFQDDMRRLIPNSDQNLLHFRHYFLSCLTASVALNELEKQEPDAPRYSEETMNEFLRSISGTTVGIELSAVMQGVVLPEVVRVDEVFRIAVNRAGDILAVQNAILGLKRDIQGRKTDSQVTSAVVQKGTGLQEAFDFNMRRLHALYNDYVVAKGQLFQFFKEDTQLRAYMGCWDTALDVCLFVYTIIERYGVNTSCEIVQNPQFKA